MDGFDNIPFISGEGGLIFQEIDYGSRAKGLCEQLTQINQAETEQSGYALKMLSSVCGCRVLRGLMCTLAW